VLAATIVVYVSAPGSRQRREVRPHGGECLRITFPYILFISLRFARRRHLNTWKRLRDTGADPGACNSPSFSGRCFSRLFRSAVMSRLAVFVGGVLQLGFQIPALARIGMLPRPRLSFRTLACGGFSS